MDHLRQIRDYDHIKLLADARRLAILRLLMAEQATLTQLGQALAEHPARVRHHVKLLEQAGLIEQVEERVVRGFVEKYYRARARAFMLQQLILPASTNAGALVILGSHDLALEMLAARLHEDATDPVELYLVPVGSLDGLVALRQGLSQAAGCHLLDVESSEYNLPFVRSLFPDRDIALVTVAHRQQGLLVQPGNPLGLSGLAALAQTGVTIVNRNRGSGTRLWLDRQLEKEAIPTQELSGYEREVRTHTAVAEAVRSGKANAGIGLMAAAQKNGLDFVPLFEERFDLALPRELLVLPPFQHLFDLLASPEFRHQVEELGGYSTRETGCLLHP